MFRPLRAISLLGMARLQSSSTSSADRSRRCRLPASHVVRRFVERCMPAPPERLHMEQLHTPARLAAITPIRLATEMSETGEARASPDLERNFKGSRHYLAEQENSTCFEEF